jgi:long-chain acyl-CoA synthetase
MAFTGRRWTFLPAKATPPVWRWDRKRFTLLHSQLAAVKTSRLPNQIKKMTTLAPLTTINDLFRRVSAAANPRAVLWQDEFGQWQPLSSDQIYQRVRALGQAFLSWGAQKGDRIALISENRWEWAVTDFAALAIGAIDVPIYPTLTGEQIAVLIQDAGCKIALVSTRQQFDKLNAVRDRTSLERIVIMDSAAVPEGAIAFSDLMVGADARGAEHDPVFDALLSPRTWPR